MIQAYTVTCIIFLTSHSDIDFTFQEREAAAQMFKGKRGQQLARDMGKRAKTFVPGAPVAGAAEVKRPPGAAPGGPPRHDIDAIKVVYTSKFSITPYIDDKCYYL